MDEASIASLGYIHSLQVYLRSLGYDFSKSYLMGISGDAFKFFYDRVQPRNSAWVFLNNPLRSASNALGFQHTIEFHETLDEARKALEEHFSTGRPAVLPFGERFPLLYPDLRIELPEGESVISEAELKEAWTPDEGFLELGLYGYYFFTLGQRDREPKPREVYLGSFRRATKIARAFRRVRGCTIGLQAYEELMAVLSSKRDLDRVVPSEPYRIASWNDFPSLLLLESRRATIAFLEESVSEFQEKEETEALAKAIGLYQKTVSALQEVRELHPATDPQSPAKLILPPEQSPLSKGEYRRFYRACRRAAGAVEKAYKVEDKAVDELRNIINISEKTKM